MGLSRTRDNIYENKGTIYYSTSFNIDWPNNSYNESTTYSGQICGKSVTNTNGSVTVTSLSAGSSYSYTNNYIICNYSCNYTYTVTETKHGFDANGNPTSWTELVEKVGSESGSIKNDLGDITIYTHPGPFKMGAKSGIDYPNDSDSIIVNILDSKIINNEWIPQFQAAYRWYNQKNISYNPANITYDYSSDSNNGGMKVKQNDPISAEWFNNCMKGMRQFGKNVDDVKKDELITASLINQMNFTGTS